MEHKMAEEKSVEKVTMEDGREVEFAGKRKMLKYVDIQGDHIYVRFDFRNGETRTFKVPHSLIHQAAGHGISQKIGDETAGLEDVGDMVIAVDKQIERLAKGEWRATREGGSSLAGTSVLLRALMELSGKGRDEVKAFLETKTMAEKRALRNSKQVKPIVDRLEAEKGKKGPEVDTDELLAAL